MHLDFLFVFYLDKKFTNFGYENENYKMLNKFCKNSHVFRKIHTFSEKFTRLFHEKIFGHYFYVKSVFLSSSI